MSWLLCALLAPALFATGNCIDKYVLENRVKDYLGVPLYVTILSATIALVSWFIAGCPMLNLAGARLLLSGTLLFGGYILYYHALTKATVSYVGMVFQLIPVMILVGAALFLHEELHARHLVGFTLILGACLTASIEKGKDGFRITEAFWLVVLADLLFAISTLVVKSVIGQIGLSTTVAFEAVGLTIGGVLMALVSRPARDAFRTTMRHSGLLTLAILALNEGIYLMAKIAGFLAIAWGPVALASALGGTQVFYVLIYGVVLTVLFPRTFKEDLRPTHLLRQTALAAVVFLGIWVIR